MYVTVDDNGLNGNLKANDGNIVMYSSCKSLESKLSFHNFSIKYVMAGDELYRLKSQDFALTGGEYLLCNHHCEGKVVIDSKTNVKGICIDVSRELLSEVVASYLAPDTNVLDLDLCKHFNSQDFIEHQFKAQSTHLGQLLTQLDKIISNKPYDDYRFEPEFYYRLSEGIVGDYIPVVKQFQSLRCIKSDTKRDLLRRLSKGKHFIDLNYTHEIDIMQVAAESNISQYHFFRLFKTVYGVSPYQYIKQKRMEKAKEILVKHRLPLTQLAMEVGYNDIFSFSKAYKQFFGCPPSQQF